RALANPHRDNHFGSQLDEPFGFFDKVRDDFLPMSRQIRQVETADAETDDALFHAVTAHDSAIKGEQFFVIDDQTKPVAEKGGDMEASFHRRDHWNIHRRPAAVHAEIKHAQRHYRVVALFFGPAISVNERRRDKLNLRRRDAVKIRGSLDVDDADLNL